MVSKSFICNSNCSPSFLFVLLIALYSTLVLLPSSNKHNIGFQQCKTMAALFVMYSNMPLEYLPHGECDVGFATKQ